MNAKTAARRSSRCASGASASSSPDCTIEVLIPDFKANPAALEIVMREEPDILNHNVETVPRIFKAVQPQDNYEWALATLAQRQSI